MLRLPRYVIYKKLASGRTGYYYNVPTVYRKLQCPVPNEPLGKDFSIACRRASTLNGLFDEWDQSRRGMPVAAPSSPTVGSVDWLFSEYKKTKAFTEKVAPRSRQDYDWAMRELANIVTKVGDRVGERPIKAITPRGADKLYEQLINGPSSLLKNPLATDGA